jgi:hypothetical protein
MFEVSRDVTAVGDEQLGRCVAEQSKAYRLYWYSGKLTLAAMYFGELESPAAPSRRR